MSITENMGKKSLVALMAISALVPVMSVEVSASTPNAESDFNFSNGVITEYTGVSKDVVIPDTIGGVAVTEIGSRAFYAMWIHSVKIPDSVTEIGDWAFSTNNLTSVEIPNSVSEIGSYAFQNNNLRSVEIPNSVSEIGTSAFQNNELTSVEIPKSVTEIGDGTFRDNKLGSVEIPDSVTVIGSRAFSDNKLTAVEIPDSVTSIERYAFINNDLTSVKIGESVSSLISNPFSDNRNLHSIIVSQSNPHFTSTENNNAIYSKDGTRLYTGTESMANNMLDTLTSIGGYALSNFDLTSVTIPNSVTSIGGYAFVNNPLTKVTIPETVTAIGSDAFKPSSPLTTEDVPIYGLEGSEAETYATTNDHPFNPPEPIESSQDATLNLFGGTLSLDAPLFETFGTHELQSDIQTVTSSFLDSFKVYDARGTGEGWRLDVTSTQMEIVEPEDGFKEGTSTHILPVGTLALDPLESIEPFNDSKGTLPSPILDTTSIIDDGAVTIAKADVGEGMGAFELTFGDGAFSATIDPSTAKIDKINYPDSDTPYEATVTWTLVSAP